MAAVGVVHDIKKCRKIHDVLVVEVRSHLDGQVVFSAQKVALKKIRQGLKELLPRYFVRHPNARNALHQMHSVVYNLHKNYLRLPPVSKKKKQRGKAKKQGTKNKVEGTGQVSASNVNQTKGSSPQVEKRVFIKRTGPRAIDVASRQTQTGNSSSSNHSLVPIPDRTGSILRSTTSRQGVEATSIKMSRNIRTSSANDSRHPPAPEEGMSLRDYIAAHEPVLLAGLEVLLEEGYDDANQIRRLGTFGEDLRRFAMESLASSARQAGVKVFDALAAMDYVTRYNDYLHP
ncbi:hypothetical protein BJ165DRAFT_1401889 [Panaeolus papilionaceus]|nr:hypothetical protein BJ165DRAFT_1401889 [Panaeolus papilionaceus]